MLKKDDGLHFEAQLVRRFVQLLGIYPPGTLVKLASESIAVVTRVHAPDPYRPRVKVLFRCPYDLPRALLHGSLLRRLVAGAFEPRALAAGAAGNALAIGVFAATVAGSAIAWRHSHPSLPRSQPRSHGAASEH